MSSAYHEKCIAKSVKAIHEASARAQSEKSYPQNAYRDCNVVAQERIWSEYVQKEMKTAKTWYGDQVRVHILFLFFVLQFVLSRRVTNCTGRKPKKKNGRGLNDGTFSWPVYGVIYT